MSLWTPYVQEVALDLSKTAVKVEPVSPVPGGPPDTHTPPPVTGYLYPHYPAHDGHYTGYHVGYTYPQPSEYTVLTVSPESVGSSWSQYQSHKSAASEPSPPEPPELYDTKSLSDDVEYQAFERDALQAMAEKNGGTILGNNPRMRRAVQAKEAADDSYRKQRERNNFAAKQSRDRRKLREVRLAFQVTYLKKKMAALRSRLAAGVCGRCSHIYEN